MRQTCSDLSVLVRTCLPKQKKKFNNNKYIFGKRLNAKVLLGVLKRNIAELNEVVVEKTKKKKKNK